MARGDHIYVRRRFYAHHGIDLGAGKVIHFSGTPFARSGATVRVSTLADFLQGGVLRVRVYPWCLPVEDSIRLAFSLEGQGGYSLFASNCEHFATLCKLGEARSLQVRNGVRASLLGVPLARSLAGTAGIVGAVVVAPAALGIAATLVGANMIRRYLDERDARADPVLR